MQNYIKLIIFFLEKIFQNYKNLFNFFFYNQCIACLDEISNKSIFCNECFSNLQFIRVFCEKCGNPIDGYLNKYKIKNCYKCETKNEFNKGKIYFDRSRSLFIYKEESSINLLISNIKNSNNEYIYKQISKLFITFFYDYISEFDFIACVPNHIIRFAYKNLNSPELIAENLIKSLKEKDPKKFPKKIFRIIKKTKFNSPQTKKTFKERMKNNQNTFAFNSKLFNKCEILNAKILLIDDVTTTGATANECAKILKNNGASFVGLLTVAKTYRD